MRSGIFALGGGLPTLIVLGLVALFIDFMVFGFAAMRIAMLLADASCAGTICCGRAYQTHVRVGNMRRISMTNHPGVAAALLAGLALAAGMAGCRVQVDKGANGEDKKVQIDTPFGAVHVNTDQTTAADLGLPVYPGAESIKDGDDHKSADVHMGFGEWELRVRAISYGTPDKREQVVAFYKKALSRYGDVITCQGNTAVGTPTATSEGLTCEEDKHGNVKVDAGDFHTDYGQFSLKAGSRRHQHIVGFDDSKGGQTRFELVALDLPVGIGGSDKSD